MPDLKDLIVVLAGIHINDRDRSRVVNVAGHLITFILEERWHRLSEHQQQALIKDSANRLWKNYMTKRKNYELPPTEAAKQAISEEIEKLKQLFNPNHTQ
jgi:hypothetical protein